MYLKFKFCFGKKNHHFDQNIENDIFGFKLGFGQFLKIFFYFEIFPI